MRLMLKLLLSVVFLFLAVALLGVDHASANPGRIASECVSATRQSGYSEDQIVLRNNCNYQVFAIYCGQIRYTSGRCNGRGRSNYYTHSVNLRGGQSFTVGIERGGRIDWGACEGSISFTNEGHFTDWSNGSYRCERR